jgi:DNA invertase Pin-like site-specific DNA recombinase
MVQQETNLAAKGKSSNLRVSLYSRVSKDDDSQTPENQLLELRAYCARQGYDIANEYLDFESGRKGKAERKRLTKSKKQVKVSL